MVPISFPIFIGNHAPRPIGNNKDIGMIQFNLERLDQSNSINSALEISKIITRAITISQDLVTEQIP